MPAALSIQQEAASRFLPGGLVGLGQGVEIGRLGGWIFHPFTQQGRAVDQVDSQAVEFVFVAEVAPQRVVRIAAADGLEGQCLDTPGLEGGMVVYDSSIKKETPAVSSVKTEKETGETPKVTVTAIDS